MKSPGYTRYVNYIMLPWFKSVMSIANREKTIIDKMEILSTDLLFLQVFLAYFVFKGKIENAHILSLLYTELFFDYK